MIQILPRNPNFGERFGSGLNNQLELQLSQLAQNKASQLQHQQMLSRVIPGLQALGIPQDQASQIAGLPENIQREIVKNQLQGPQNQMFAEALQNILGGSDSNGLQNLQQQSNNNQKPNHLNIPSGLNADKATKLAQLGLQKQQNQQKLDLMKEKERSRQDQFERKLASTENQFAKKIQNAQEAPLRKEIVKATSDLDRRAISAKKNIKIYDQLEKIVNTGKVRTGNNQQLLSKIGLNGFFNSSETDIAKKLIARLAQGAGAAFNVGANLSKFDVQAYQDSLPSLFNNEDGLKKIIKINKLEEKAYEIQHKYKQEIIKENNGKIPLDIMDQIADRSEDQLANLSQQAQNIITNPEEAKPNKIQSNIVDELPNPEFLTGKRIRDTLTGKILISDGTSWKEA